MAAEYSANAVQTVPVNGSVVFTESPVPCNRGLIYHRDESGLFRLASPSTMGCGCRRRCCCSDFPSADYTASFHANIAVPEDPAGTVEPISLAVAIDGEVDPSSIMTFTPAAVGDFGNVGAEVVVSVPCICRCGAVSIRNVSTQPILVQNENIVFDFSGVRR
ncbi:MAG: hypothetical protein IJ906_06405 [Oscillospiraceae bacterium]|nr:hypothetical protein [Oscillospiraceae bacterium]